MNRWTWAATVVGAGLLLGACSNQPVQGHGTASIPPAPVAALALAPATGGHDLSPVAPVTATVTSGTLTTVTLKNATSGAAVKGDLSADKTTWKATEDLGYGKSYTLSASGV